MPELGGVELVLVRWDWYDFLAKDKEKWEMGGNVMNHQLQVWILPYKNNHEFLTQESVGGGGMTELTPERTAGVKKSVCRNIVGVFWNIWLPFWMHFASNQESSFVGISS